MMDFDRCSGEFSNPITIYNETSTDSTISLTGAASVEFSPNARFIYISNVTNLNQYDLQSTNVQDSVRLYTALPNDYAQIGMIQLAPNGKLYGCTWNGGFWFFHVVNHPDSAGLNCNFIYGGQPTSSANSNCLPNMINYNLGSLTNSGCDTIKTDTTKTGVGLIKITGNDLLRIMPNPADKYAYVEMGIHGSYEFELLNATGQLVDKKETRQVDIFDTEYLASGIYFLRVIDKSTNTEAATKKIAVAH